MGNRRFIVAAVLSFGLACALSGCSTTGSLTGSDAAAVTIGQQALTSTSSGSSSSTTGWSSEATCPDSLRQGMASTVPAGGSLTTLDAGSISGVPADPEVTAGDVPSCAFALSASATGRTVDEVIFIGMADSYQSAIVAKLKADGFVAGAAIPVNLGTQQTFTNGTSRVAIAKLNADGLSVFAVIG